MFSRGEQWN